MGLFLCSLVIRFLDFKLLGLMNRIKPTALLWAFLILNACKPLEAPSYAYVIQFNDRVVEGVKYNPRAQCFYWKDSAGYINQVGGSGIQVIEKILLD